MQSPVLSPHSELSLCSLSHVQRACVVCAYWWQSIFGEAERRQSKFRRGTWRECMIWEISFSHWVMHSNMEYSPPAKNEYSACRCPLSTQWILVDNSKSFFLNDWWDLIYLGSTERSILVISKVRSQRTSCTNSYYMLSLYWKLFTGTPAIVFRIGKFNVLYKIS